MESCHIWFQCSVVTGGGTLGQLDEKYFKVLFCSKFISLAKVGHRDCMGYGSKNAKTRHHHSFKRSLARSMWTVFTGIWALVLSDTDPIEARSNDLRDPRAHFLPNRTSSRVWPVTKPANKTNSGAEAGKLGHKDENKYKYEGKVYTKIRATKNVMTSVWPNHLIIPLDVT